MNLQETLALLDKLNAVGAKHFKSSDLEVSLAAQSFVHTSGDAQPITGIQQTIVTNNLPEQPKEPYNAENTAKAKNLIDMLKMTPEELANQIFPEGA